MLCPAALAVSRYMKLLVILLFCAGCSASQVGIRPTEPPLPLTGGDPCRDYLTFVGYTQELGDAYYARSSMNRGGSYASAATAAGAVAGTAGLTIGDTPTPGTLGLVSVAHGFLSTIFNVVNNENLAAIYTEAGIRLASAIDESFATMMTTRDPQACIRAHVQLRHVVTTARNNLERARTDSASAALQRALAQTNHYEGIVSQFPQVVSRSRPAGQQESDPLTIILDKIDKRVEALEKK